MSLREPENTRNNEPLVEDSGIHVPDPERAPISLWQMTVTALLVIAILCIFFYGVTEQREEVSGPAQQQSATSVPPPSAPSAEKSPQPATTGQGR